MRLPTLSTIFQSRADTQLANQCPPLVPLIFLVILTSEVYADCNLSVSMRNLNADVIIGGLFPVHYYSSHSNQYTLNAYALTWIEAFHHSINLINKNQTLLPGIKLGYDVRDSCNDERYALRHALDFTLDTSYFVPSSPLSKGGMCKCYPNATSRLMAVVGGASSSVSVGISHLLGVHCTPQVSYSSTSVTLSDKNRYPSFLRTMPSDVYQAKAIADFIQYFNWTFVNLLASDDDYGRLGSDELRKELIKRNVCRAVDRTFPANLTSLEARDIVAEIKHYKGKASVIVLWCEIGSAKTILAEAMKMGFLGMTWLGTETWGNNVDLFTLDPAITHGIIGIKPTVFKVADFEAHLLTLSHKNTTHNPWLSLYWDEVFKCGQGNVTTQTQRLLYMLENTVDRQLSIPCPDGSTADTMLPLNKYPNVMSSVYAIAYGLHNALGCNSTRCSNPIRILNGRKLLPMMKTMSFNLPNSSMKVTFDDNGDLMYASYTFTNLVSYTHKFPAFREIGSWNGENGNLKLSVDRIRWSNGTQVPLSRCSSPCKPGQYKIGGRQPCCWECASCQPDHFSSSSSQRSCSRCPLLSISNFNRTACMALKTTTWTFYSLIGALMLGLIAIGVMLTAFVAFVLFKFRDTPVVKSSNRELTMLQICCIFLLFLLPLIYFFDTTVLSCVFRVTSFAILHTIVLSVVFTKTYRLLLIFRKMTTEESKLLRNSYQALLVLSLVILQLITLGAWHLFYKPRVHHEINRTTRTIILHCGTHDDVLSFVMSGLLFLLMLCSAYMAFKARKLPEGFNEARNISFAMFINSLLWFAYIPVYFSLSRIGHPFLYAVSNALSNFIILLLLYGNKVKIMLLHPELNTTAQYRRNTAHSTMQAVLKARDASRPSSLSLSSYHVDRSQTVDSMCSTRLSPSLNRRQGVQDKDILASSVILNSSSKRWFV